MSPNRKSKTQKKSPAKKKRKQKVIPTKDYNIPKEKFIETLDEVNKEIEWGGESSQRRCSVPIQDISSDIRQSYKSMSFKLLEEARLCVLQRDWKNLAYILTMAKPGYQDHNVFFQVFVRYAAICLAHNPDKNLLDMFTQGVTGCAGESEKQKFINSLTKG